MRALRHITTILGIILVVSSCQKEKKSEVTSNDPATASFSFIKLEAQDTILASTTTPVTAITTGNNLTYTWSVDPVGVLLGNGNSIVFNACCGGEHYVTCEVSDGKTTLSKTVMIYGKLKN